MDRRSHTFLLCSLIGLMMTVAPLPAHGAAAAECLISPVLAEVAEPFRMPSCEYCPGHRGIEFATRPGSAVVAAAAGTITFAGTVAGTRYLVIRHENGVRATYGLLATLASGLTSGVAVRAGSIVGNATDRLYFGLRADDADESPIDPTPLLGRWRYRARLIPTDGRPSRPAPPPRLVCRNTSVPR